MAPGVPSTPRGIFISYRRQETAYPAGWLYRELKERFGSEQIFKDVDNIDPGDDFYERIDEAVGSCAVLLALIGDQWVDAVDDEGARRLDDPQDFVRLEIEAALRRRVRVVPVLVTGARMPRLESIPQSLSELTRRQAVELSPERFEADIQRLLAVIERTLDEARAPQDAVAPAPVKPSGAENSGGPGEDDFLSGHAALPEVVSAMESLPGWARRPDPSDRTEMSTVRSGIRPWVALALVATGLIMLWVNWPGPAGTITAWKDADLTGWQVYRAWTDVFVWAPALMLVGAVGAAWSQVMLGATLGAAAYSLGTATVLLVGGLSYDQTGPWIATLVLALVVLVVGWPVRRVDAAKPAPLPAAGAAAVVAAVLWLVADAVESNGYTSLQVTSGAGVFGQVVLLAVAAPVFLDLGGRRWRTTFVSAAATYVLVGLIDLANYPEDISPTVVVLILVALTTYAAGVVMLPALFGRARRGAATGVQTESP